MFQIHRTADGEEMMIAQMSDDHLIKQIRLLCTKISQCVQILNSVNVEGSALIAALRPEFSQEAMKKQATNSIKKLDEQIKPYVMEASLRNINISAFLQEAYQRKTKIQTAQDIGLKLCKETFKETYITAIDDED